MAEGRALVLFWTKNGNTEKVARRIHDTLQKAGMTVSIARINQELTVEYLDYNLIFLGAPVYENLSPKPVLAFLHANRRRGGKKLLPSAPEVPGVAAVPFCTYGGGHTGSSEAEPMLKHIGQYFEHEGGDPEVEASRAHPSDDLDYFLPKADIEARGLMPALLGNYLDKHQALNRTAEALVRSGVGVVAAPLLHGGDDG